MNNQRNTHQTFSGSIRAQSPPNLLGLTPFLRGRFQGGICQSRPRDARTPWATPGGHLVTCPERNPNQHINPWQSRHLPRSARKPCPQGHWTRTAGKEGGGRTPDKKVTGHLPGRTLGGHPSPWTMEYNLMIFVILYSLSRNL